MKREKKKDLKEEVDFNHFLKNGITQLGLVVDDIDKWTKKLYDLLGTTSWEYYIYDKSTLKIMRMNGKDTEFKMISAVANLGKLRLELIKPLNGDMVYESFIANQGYGKLQHIGIAVDDISKALRAARSSGIDVIMEGSGYGLDGDGYFAYLDTIKLFGITIELMERPKKRRKPYKVYPEKKYS